MTLRLTGAEVRERDHFEATHPRFLIRRFKKSPTGRELALASHNFERELEERFGVPFSVAHYAYFGRRWTRTGFLIANIAWGQNLPVGDEESGEVVRATYKRLVPIHQLPLISTGHLWHESGLGALDFLKGLSYLREKGIATQQVGYKGEAIYVTMRR